MSRTFSDAIERLSSLTIYQAPAPTLAEVIEQTNQDERLPFACRVNEATVGAEHS
jgi:hypothetical protein